MHYEPDMHSGRKILENVNLRQETYDDMLRNASSTQGYLVRNVDTTRVQGYPSMSITLKDYWFSNNEMSQSVIFDVGGHLRVNQKLIHSE